MPLHVNFFGADGRLIGQETTLQLKSRESAAAEVSQPSNFVRASWVPRSCSLHAEDRHWSFR